jgi:hypothetical protein
MSDSPGTGANFPEPRNGPAVKSACHAGGRGSSCPLPLLHPLPRPPTRLQNRRDSHVGLVVLDLLADLVEKAVERRLADHVVGRHDLRLVFVVVQAVLGPCAASR